MAALELFTEQGYTETTVEDIAVRAGLKKRSFFRHFSDKREVLFGGGHELEELFQAALSAVPTSASPVELVEAALRSVGEALSGRRETGRQRQEVVEANPELQERELIKLASAARAVGTALRERDVPDLSADLLAQAALAVFRTGFVDWVGTNDRRTLPDVLTTTLAALRAALGEGHVVHEVEVLPDDPRAAHKSSPTP